jgi:hypothetical protein
VKHEKIMTIINECMKNSLNLDYYVNQSFVKL